MGRPLRALIVDDSERDAELMLRELRRGGFDVGFERVDTAEAMSAALAKQPWDIVFSDYSMPRFDPFSALSLTRAKGLDLPFIIVSGTVGEEAAVKAMKAGAHDYLRKDKLSPRLIPVVERELGEAASRAERRRVERALGEKEVEYRQLVESVRAVVWKADARTFRFTFVSPEAEKILGYPLRMWLDEPDFWSDHIALDDRERVVALCRKNTEEKRDHQFEYRMVAADGRPVWFQNIVRVVVEGDEIRELVGVMVDISEKKRAQAGQSAHYRIADAARSAEDMDALYAAVHGIVGELTYARNFYIALYDEGSDTLSFPYFADEVDTECPPMRPGKSLTGHVLRTGRPLLATPVVFAELVERGEVDLVGAASVDWLGAPLKKGDRCFGVLVVQSYRGDVRFTEADEEFLVYATDQLAVAIDRKRAEEESRLQREALYQSEKIAAMGTMLAGVAHELNNPLAVVMGQASLLVRRAGAGPLADRAEKIVQAAERCARIVANFLAMARQRPPERRQVSLNKVVEEAFELLGYPLRVDDVEVRLELAADLPALWADPHQLQQVVVNLVTNAHQALRAGPQPRRITASTRVERGRVVLEVADTGPGIPAEVRSRLFEPFFTTKPPGQGTGLGLSLCLGIVETHGGTIAAESEPGQGAVFRVELPVDAPPEKASVTGAEEPAPVKGKAILIVDDEQEVADMLADLLSEDGHRVDTAPNGAAALEKLAARTYDAVLSDIKMPVLDGPGLYREVERRFPRLAHRFVFLTGDSLSPETREFLQKAARPTVEKPVGFDDLRKAIRDAVDAR